MRMVNLPSGRSMPALGQGTWRMGESRAKRKGEVDALRLGIDLGLTLIDTAEMYGEGGAESVVGEAIAGRRDQVFLVSKVYPHNASRRGVAAACKRSLERLATDHLDLYLLHWRSTVAIEETLEAFQALRQSGAILDFGVSNFDVADMETARRAPGGSAIATNQVLYNPLHRGIEWDLLPWSRRHATPIMAYSPIEQGAMLRRPELGRIAGRHGATAAQVALAWLLRGDDVSVIVKAADAAHLRDDRGALDLALTDRDLAEIDRAFPPPRKRVPLEMN